MIKSFKEYLSESYDYASYRKMIDDLLAEGKSTGTTQSEAITAYSKMNVQRMKKWDKIFKVDADLQAVIEKIDRKMTWLVITEGWCGDAAQIVPVLVKMADLTDSIDIRFVLRDENPELMDQYLTNGGKSIPKLIALDADTLEEVFNWGPRPAPAQEILLRNKALGNDYAEELHKWYALDKARSTQQEFHAILSEL